MLLELTIKNFAIIDDLKVQFGEGLNIITGETGTGKSILLEALGVILGDRINRDYIRTGEDKAVLEAVFYIKEVPVIKEQLLKYEIPLSHDNILIINKTINKNSPSMSKINGKTVNLSMLKDVTQYLIDIFGQHEHQSLLDVSNHIDIIDSFGDLEMNLIKDEIRSKYSDYMYLKKELDNLEIDDSTRKREIDILEFQINEISSVDIDIKEDSKLKDKFLLLNETNNIQESLFKIISSINPVEYTENSILAILNERLQDLFEIKELSPEIFSFYERLNSIIIELEDLNREVLNYTEKIDLNREELYLIENRLDSINSLKLKYGETLEEILEYQEASEERLNRLLNQEKEIEKVTGKLKVIEEDILKLSRKLSNKRKSIASIIEKKLIEELRELKMDNVQFKVNFEESDIILSNGIDKVEFLISTNLGENLKPLAKIASGGEMSRIMLAFKNILIDVDDIKTMVFDEIDTGISGRTAQVVGEKIYNISKKAQIICISHLPQVAAMADNHYSIKKKVVENKTKSEISKLDEESRIMEMARLIGGVDLTDTTIKHAKEMIKLSEEFKEK